MNATSGVRSPPALALPKARRAAELSARVVLPGWPLVCEEALVFVSFPFGPVRRHPTPNGNEIKGYGESTDKDHERRKQHLSTSLLGVRTWGTAMIPGPAYVRATSKAGQGAGQSGGG